MINLFRLKIDKLLPESINGENIGIFYNEFDKTSCSKNRRTFNDQNQETNLCDDKIEKNFLSCLVDIFNRDKPN